MPKRPRELSAAEVRRLATPGMHAVGGVAGLCLRVAPGGSRSWILRATIGSRRRDLGLGGFPDVSLSRAREIAREYRELIRAGRDPSLERRAARAALIAEQAKQITFDEAARRCHAAKIPEFRNEKHKKDWLSSLERYASPVIGNLPVSDVELAHVLQVLEPIWHTKTETASRLRQRIESVLTWATVSGFRSGDNPARWVGNLKEVLPDPSKIYKTKHYPALPFGEVGRFMAHLRQKKGIGPRALEFAILAAARSSEVRGMVWSEVDFKEKVWTVPADRIKAGRQHKVPLSDDALSILENMPRMLDSPYVFPAPRGGQLSDMALSALVRRMNEEDLAKGGAGYKDPSNGRVVVPHGFRSTFKDWCRSRTSYPDEVSELALAHVNSDATRAAYARDELLPKRTRLMRDWARFCNTIKEKGEVTPIRRKA